jgi:hypothetical protein
MTAGPRRSGHTMSELVRLHPDDVREIARLVADRVLAELGDGPAAPARLLTAAQVAERFGLSRRWIYENREQLGAVQVGSGERPRLRFDPAAVADALDPRREGKGPQNPDPARRKRSGRKRTAAGDGGCPTLPDLLPIKGAAQ